MHIHLNVSTRSYQVPQGTFRKFYASAYRLRAQALAPKGEPVAFNRKDYLAWIETVSTWRRLGMLFRARQQHTFAVICFDKCETLAQEYRKRRQVQQSELQRLQQQQKQSQNQRLRQSNSVRLAPLTNSAEASPPLNSGSESDSDSNSDGPVPPSTNPNTSSDSDSDSDGPAPPSTPPPKPMALVSASMSPRPPVQLSKAELCEVADSQYVNRQRRRAITVLKRLLKSLNTQKTDILLPATNLESVEAQLHHYENDSVARGIRAQEMTKIKVFVKLLQVSSRVHNAVIRFMHFVLVFEILSCLFCLTVILDILAPGPRDASVKEVQKIRQDLQNIVSHPLGREENETPFEPCLSDGGALGIGACAIQMARVTPSYGCAVTAGVAWLFGAPTNGKVVFTALETCLPHRQGE